MKAQASIEFLMIFGIGLMLTLPVILLLLTESRSGSQHVTMTQADHIARKIVSAAESVYAFGEPTSTTLQVYMPGGIRNITISNRTITIISSAANSSITYRFSMNVTGEVRTGNGLHNIRVAAGPGLVNITEVSGNT